MDAEPEFIRYVRDQLQGWAPVVVRRMFGGYGIFRDGKMFALIHEETLYLKSDAASRPCFAAAGMGPFRYRRRGRLVALGYHAAPPEALEDGALLADWADRGFAAALRCSMPPKAARKNKPIQKIKPTQKKQNKVSRGRHRRS